MDGLLTSILLFQKEMVRWWIYLETTPIANIADAKIWSIEEKSNKQQKICKHYTDIEQIEQHEPHIKTWGGRRCSWRNKTALGSRRQADISLKIEDWKSNKTTDDQQSEFRSVSEFYIINFLNKLKIVENRRKNETIKINVYGYGYAYGALQRLTDPFLDLRAPTDVPAEPPSIGPSRRVIAKDANITCARNIHFFKRYAHRMECHQICKYIENTYNNVI